MECNMYNLLLISLGCDKNLVDSEKMLGLLSAAGYRIVDDESEADVILINTCCFINDAKEESIETIIDMASLKTDGRLKVLAITGCLAQRYAKEIQSELPEVDVVIGTTGYTDIVGILNDAMEKVTQSDEQIGLPLIHCPDISLTTPSVPESRRVTAGGYTAYLKIAEGCNKMCSYCIIPYIRGRYRSFPMEDLVEEARILAEGGARELILVAQETTLYGVDLYGKKSLHILLEKLAEIDGIEWIRILYCYPEEIYDELIETIKREPKICHYIDMPIQHSEDHILKRMNRRTNKAELIANLKKLREEIPDMCIRTTLITGFPGETDEDVENLIDFVDEMEFDRLGVFTFSPEEGTKAYEMEDQIDEDLKAERRDHVMELQAAICEEKAAASIGKTLKVLIEGYLYEEGIYIGRTYMDAPKIDGNVFIECDRELMSGDFVNVKITGATDYDLVGQLV